MLQRKASKMGAGLGKTTGWIHRATLRKCGVTMISGVAYEKIDDDGLHIVKNDIRQTIPADTIIVCAGQEPLRTLAEDLSGGMPCTLSAARTGPPNWMPTGHRTGNPAGHGAISVTVPTAMLDHLVVAANTLDQGSAYVQDRLGVSPAGGGKHVAMGTHNRLLKLGPGQYLEVIAIDPEGRQPDSPRWFNLDDPDLQARLKSRPQPDRLGGANGCRRCPGSSGVWATD
jgi:hypothetical protein